MPTPPPHPTTPPSPSYKPYLAPWAQSSPVYNSLPIPSLVNIVGEPIPDPSNGESLPDNPVLPLLPTLPTIAKPGQNVVIIQIDDVPCRPQPDQPIHTSTTLLCELWKGLTDINYLAITTYSQHPFTIARFPCWKTKKPKNIASFTFHIIDDEQSTQALQLLYNQQNLSLFGHHVKVVLPEFHA